MNFMHYTLVVDGCKLSSDELKDTIEHYDPELKGRFDVGCGLYDWERIIRTSNLIVVAAIRDVIDAMIRNEPCSS